MKLRSFIFSSLVLVLGLASSFAQSQALETESILLARDGVNPKKFCLKKIAVAENGVRVAQMKMISDYSVQGWMWDEDIGKDDPFFYEMDESAAVAGTGGLVFKAIKDYRRGSTKLASLRKEADSFGVIGRYAAKLHTAKNPIGNGQWVRSADGIREFRNIFEDSQVVFQQILGDAYKTTIGSTPAARAGSRKALRMQAKQFGKAAGPVVADYAKYGILAAAGGAIVAGLLSGTHKTIFKADTQALSTITGEQAEELFELASPVRPGYCGVQAE